MTLEFLMFQVIPDVFIWIPVWRIGRQVKYMKTLLAVNKALCFFDVWGRA